MFDWFKPKKRPVVVPLPPDELPSFPEPNDLDFSAHVFNLRFAHGDFGAPSLLCFEFRNFSINSCHFSGRKLGDFLYLADVAVADGEVVKQVPHRQNFQAPKRLLLSFIQT